MMNGIQNKPVMPTRMRLTAAVLSLAVFLTCVPIIACDDYYIIPSQDFPCSFNSCVTLSTFASQTYVGEPDNITLFVYRGNHSLTSVLEVERVQQFVMRSLGDTSLGTYVTCNNEEVSNVHLQFSQIQYLLIKGITFMGCGTNVVISVESASIEESSFIAMDGSALEIFDSIMNVSNTEFNSNTLGSEQRDAQPISLLTSSNTSPLNIVYTVGGAMSVSTSTVVIDQCLFHDNRANFGGAIFAQKQSNITVTNSTFTSNQATNCNSGLCFGGCLFAYRGSHVQIDKKTAFVNNTSDQYGGVAALLDNSTLILSSSYIENSHARTQGGALAISIECRLILNDSRIVNNQADTDGGVIFAEKQSFVEITNNCRFIRNTATHNGGVAFIKKDSWFTMTNSTVMNNKALMSGGVLFMDDNANALIADCHFLSNRATQHGGVVSMAHGSVSTIATSIFNSSSAEQGGVVYVIDSGSFLVVSQSSFSSNRVNINGGAIHVQYDSRLLVNESTFIDNYANREGGAIYGLSMKRAELYKTNFTSNKGNIGGVITARDGSTLYVQQSRFYDNTESDLGAVIYSDLNTVTNVTDCEFRNNVANYGGVSHSTRNSTFNVINCAYINNTANNDGATIYGRAQSLVVIVNSTFINNTALNDAVVLVYDSSLFDIDNVVFYNNSAGHDGGAVYVYNGLLNVTNTTFSGNRAENSGGSIYARSLTNISIDSCSFSNNTVQTSGGAVYVQDKSCVLITDTTFSNSSANNGGILYVDVDSNITIANCLFTYSTAYQLGGAISIYNGGNVLVEQSNFTFIAGDYGGVIYGFQDSLLEFINCRFTNNKAELDGIIRVREQVELSITGGTFTKNSAENGGVLFTHSSTLSVNSSTFTSNSASKKGGVIFSNGNSTISVVLSTFSDNRADNDGGVMSLQNNTNITLDTCTFSKSLARSHGGSIGIEYSSINIINCVFSLSVAERGGGVIRAIQSTIDISNSSLGANNASAEGGIVYAHTESTLLIKDSELFNNTAGSSGGVVRLEESKANITGSSFENNSAMKYGGAISITTSEVFISGTNTFSQNFAQLHGGAIDVELSNISFPNSYDGTSKILINSNTAYQGGAVYLCRSNLYINVHTKIAHNIAFEDSTDFFANQGGTSDGGAIYALTSSIVFGNTVEFIQNNATRGGSVFLWNSTFQDDNSMDYESTREITFASNYAQQSGGAIFVSDSDCSYMSGVPQCFFHNVTQAMLRFTDNVAGSSNAAGDNLYGGLLDRCLVVGNTNLIVQSKGVLRFLNITNITDLDKIASQPLRICPCSNNKPVCNKTVLPVTIKQGNGFNIGPLVAVDQVGHPVTATVTSYFNDDEINNLLRANQMIQTLSNFCSYLSYQISFPIAPARYNLTVFAEGPCANRMESQFIVEIQVDECICPIGFVRDNQGTTCNCICDIDPTFSKYVQNCNISTESIVREGRFWITYLNNENSTSQYLIYAPCPLDYCQPPSPGVLVNLNLPDGHDSQCANNRSGLLCGQCNSNNSLSLSLGSTSCICCPDEWYALVIGIVVASFFAGLGLVVLILMFNITVAVGTLNSVIFYANIIFANRTVYFRQLSLTFVPVFISWLNLEIGLDTCFYDGMDAYAKTWLQLAFPLYIMFLVILIILISSCSTKFSNLLSKRNPVATLATLMLLSYTKLFEVIVSSLSYVTLNYPNGTTERRWLPDASVKYLEGKHIALIIVAIIVDSVGLAYTILLLTWQWLVRLSSIKIFCCVRNQKLNSFIETYHSPHSPKHRYWTGLLLLVRVLIYLISSFSLSVDPRVSLLITVIIVSSLLSYKTTLMIKTYKNKLLNAMESFVYFNIIVFTLFTWYTFDDSQNNIGKNNQVIQTVVAYVSVGTILIIFLMIIAYHVYRYGSTKVYSLGQSLKLNEKANVLASAVNGAAKENSILDHIDLSRDNGEYVPPLKHRAPLRSEVLMAECEEAPTDFDISHQSLHQSPDIDSTSITTQHLSDIQGLASHMHPRAQTLPPKSRASKEHNQRLLTLSYRGTSNESITVPLLEEDNL